MNNLNATYKGLITGLLMVAVSAIIFFTKGNFDSNLQYVVYGLYVGGVIWTLKTFHRNNPKSTSFKSYFAEGFRCFVVITLFMVLSTFVFLKLDSSMKEQMAVNFQRDLQAKGNYTQSEIIQQVNDAKDRFAVRFTSMAIFGYLVIGSMATVVTTLFFTKRKPAEQQITK